MADQRLGRLAMLSQVGDQNDLADARDQAGDMEALKSLYGIASESATQPAKIGELQSETAKNNAAVGLDNAESTYRTQLGATMPDKAEAYRSRAFEEVTRAMHDRFPGGIPDYEQGAQNVDDVPRLYNEHTAAVAAKQHQDIIDNLKKGGSADDAVASGKVTEADVAPYRHAPAPPTIGSDLGVAGSDTLGTIGRTLISPLAYPFRATSMALNLPRGSQSVPEIPFIPPKGDFWDYNQRPKTATQKTSPWNPQIGGSVNPNFAK